MVIWCVRVLTRLSLVAADDRTENEIDVGDVYNKRRNNVDENKDHNL